MMKTVFVSGILPQEICDNLSKYDCRVVKLPKNSGLSSELAYHPDLTLLPLDGKSAVAAEGCKAFLSSYYETVHTVSGIYDEYPNDCLLNNLIVDNCVIAGKRTVLHPELERFTVVRINQGYVRCSTVRLDDGHFITSDETVKNALESLNKTVLRVGNNGIKLNGFSCGFIGGCALALDGKLMFTGNLNGIESADSIKEFAANAGYETVSLTNSPMYDYGGFVVL